MEWGLPFRGLEFGSRSLDAFCLGWSCRMGLVNWSCRMALVHA